MFTEKKYELNLKSIDNLEWICLVSVPSISLMWFKEIKYIVYICSISNRNNQMLSPFMFFQNMLYTPSIYFAVEISKFQFKENNWTL